jgi:hypothetical protein
VGKKLNFLCATVMDLFVGGIPYSATEIDLQKRFSNVAGEDVEVRVPPALSKSGSDGFGSVPIEGIENNGFCFVKCSTLDGAANMVRSLNNTRWSGKKIVVEKCAKQPKSVTSAFDKEKVISPLKDAKLQKKQESDERAREYTSKRSRLKIRKTTERVKSKFLTIRSLAKTKSKKTKFVVEDEKVEEDEDVEMETSSNLNQGFKWGEHEEHDQENWLSSSKQLTSASFLISGSSSDIQRNSSPSPRRQHAVEVQEENEMEVEVAQTAPEDKPEVTSQAKKLEPVEEEANVEVVEEVGEFQWKSRPVRVPWLTTSSHELKLASSFLRSSKDDDPGMDSSSSEED